MITGFIRGPNSWNVQPNNVTILSTFNIFINAVDAFMLSHYSG